MVIKIHKEGVERNDCNNLVKRFITKKFDGRIRKASDNDITN